MCTTPAPATLPWTLVLPGAAEGAAPLSFHSGSRSHPSPEPLLSQPLPSQALLLPLQPSPQPPWPFHAPSWGVFSPCSFPALPYPQPSSLPPPGTSPFCSAWLPGIFHLHTVPLSSLGCGWGQPKASHLSRACAEKPIHHSCHSLGGALKPWVCLCPRLAARLGGRELQQCPSLTRFDQFLDTRALPSIPRPPGFPEFGLSSRRPPADNSSRWQGKLGVQRAGEMRLATGPRAFTAPKEQSPGPGSGGNSGSP